METTFTGLKLQGELGKFGQIDLSDISAFVEFPDGKVLSPTEHGTFLLWEGIFIKANLDEGEGKKCHEEGLVEHMSWLKNDDPEEIKIMSAGHDGKIKWWKYLDIENVMLDDFSNGVIHPLRTVQLINPANGRPIRIMNLVKTDTFWLIQDGNGFFVKVTPSETNDNFPVEVLFECHSGKILKSAFEPKMPMIVSIGRDEKISLTAYCSNMKEFPDRLIFQQPFSNKGIFPTCSDIPKRELNDAPYVISVGYSNGLFKIFSLSPVQKRVDLIFQARPHTQPIQIIKFSPDESYFITVTKEEIFFFIVEHFDKIVPWCCIKKEEIKIVDVDWHPDSKKILVGYSNGTLEEIEIPLHFDNTQSYILKEYNKREIKIKKAETEIEKIDEKKRQRQKEQGKLKEEPEPGTVYSCKYIGLHSEDDFLVTSQKPYNESLYICNFNFEATNTEQRPFNFWRLPSGDYYIKHISTNYVFLAEHKGGLQIRNKKFMDKFVEIQPNLPGIQISSVSTSEDEKFVSICYEDGINAIYAMDTEGFNMHIDMYCGGNVNEQTQANLEQRVFPEISLQKQSIENCLSQIKQGEFTVITEDIQDELSLEDAKQAAREKEKERVANEKKEKLFVRVKKLREDFKRLKDMNNKLPEEVRLTADELIVDNNYLEIVANEQKLGLDDVNAKYDWLKANEEVTINKIKSFFLDSVHTNKVTVYGLRKNQHVCSIRCPNLPLDFQEKLDNLEREIITNDRKMDFDSLIPKYQNLIGCTTFDQQKEIEKIQGLIDKGNERIKTQTDKKEGTQAVIEPIIQATKPDIAEIEEYLNTKRLTDKALNKKVRNKGKGKDGKTIEIICPQEYNLKNKYDKIYNEKNMLLTTKHTRRIYKFLKTLYDQRENFNRKVSELRDTKITLLNNLKEYKKDIEEYNRILGLEEETYDWYSFENKDKEEDLLKIPEEDLKKYMQGKIEKDKELKEIYEEENKEEAKEDEEDDWNFEVKERQINSEIDSFDDKVERLKYERVLISYIQKLGEYELIIKQKELNKIRAYNNEDSRIISKLKKLFDDYIGNLSSLENNRKERKQNEEEKLNSQNKIKDIDDTFKKLIENEGSNKEHYEAFYKACSREPQKDANGEDKMEEEEFNLPKSLGNKSLKEEIKQQAEAKKMTLADIEKTESKLKEIQKKRDEYIKIKGNLDERKNKYLGEIQANETHKSKYINQIELAFPVSISQFQKVEPDDGRTPLELGRSIFINNKKIEELESTIESIERENFDYDTKNKNFTKDYKKSSDEYKRLKKEGEEKMNEFKNEQILKFGLEINFDKLLMASKKTTMDKYESEYRKLKLESSRQIEAMNSKIDRAKKELNDETRENSKKLSEIHKNLSDKRKQDMKLEAKNSEITKKNDKKLALEDLKKKKERLKEIMRLLKHQMDALKKEIEIFKKKGGHIYSTIASNLV
ncbi:MAG: hypothetical protein MJ252_05015 [archaeon]|nr:hypothetical protein [archaeon]